MCVTYRTKPMEVIHLIYTKVYIAFSLELQF